MVGKSIITYHEVTATAFDPVTGARRWERKLGSHEVGWTWYAQSFHAMVDDRRLYVLSYTQMGSLQAYDLADGHHLWSTPAVLPAIPDGEPAAVVEGNGTLDFLRSHFVSGWEWSSVDLATGEVREGPSTRARAVSWVNLASGLVFGDALYEPEEDKPVVNVSDATTGVRVLQLHVEGAPDESVRLAFGTLDDGQPVVITYAGGVLRGWLRGR